MFPELSLITATVLRVTELMIWGKSATISEIVLAGRVFYIKQKRESPEVGLQSFLI